MFQGGNHLHENEADFPFMCLRLLHNSMLGSGLVGVGINRSQQHSGQDDDSAIANSIFIRRAFGAGIVFKIGQPKVFRGDRFLDLA